jgi:regulatory protein
MWQQKQTGKAKQFDESALRVKCIALLARREYSFAELERKLLPLTEDEALVYKVLDWMVEYDYQSDERFANMFVRSRGVSGYGPIRIRLELNQKGIKEYLIENAFEENINEVNWSDEVDRLIEKKSKNLDFTDMKSRSKVMGYLQRRGFSLDQIYIGLDRYKERTSV